LTDCEINIFLYDLSIVVVALDVCFLYQTRKQ